MNYYEMLCVLPGTLAEDEAKQTTDAVQQVLEKAAAEKIEMEDLGKSRLAYPIKNIRYGYFRLFYFYVSAENTKGLDKKVQLVGNVLRVAVRSFDPAKKGLIKYTIAQDPTALSVPPKDEEYGYSDRRDHRGPRPEAPTQVVKEDAPAIVQTKEEKVEVKAEVKPEVKEEVVVVSEPVKVEKATPVVVKEEKKVEEAVTPKKEEKVEKTKKESKKTKAPISMDDIDQKLDELLSQDIGKV